LTFDPYGSLRIGVEAVSPDGGSDDLKVFIEYYQEQSAAAISTSNDSFPAGGGFITGNNNGGSAITVGAHYDF